MTDGQISNVAPETVSQFGREAAAAKRDLEEKQGAYRAVLKRAKSAGIDTKVLVAELANRKLEPEQVEAETRTALRYREILTGHRIDWEALAGAVQDTQLSSKEQDEKNAWEAEEAGYENGRNGGGGATDCPYPAGSILQVKWLAGWKRGQALIAASMPTEEGVTVASTRRSREKPGETDKTLN